MKASIRLIAASIATTVGLIGFTSAAAFADDGGNGGVWGSGGYGWSHGHHSRFPTLPPLLGQTGRTTVTLSPGWNLVDQSVLDTLESRGQQVYSDYWNGQGYQSSANRKADGIWVYMQRDVAVAMRSPSAASKTITVAANSWGMIGNPYGAPLSVTLQKGDAAYTYNPATGQYSQAFTGTVTLQPGQGAWLFSAAGGSYTVGIQPPTPPGGSTVTGSVYGNSTT